MRVISATLLAAQSASGRKPHKHVVIDSTNYSSRVLFIEHKEETYRDFAWVILDNHDRILDGVDITGKKFNIGHGYYTGVTAIEPDGDGAGNEYNYGRDLWVKSQQIISSEGQCICQLYCEGVWVYLREQKLMGKGTAVYNYFSYTTNTVYEISEDILETGLGFTLTAYSNSDGIVDVFTPQMELNSVPYESAASMLYKLIWMTKSFIRARANTIFEWIYPQAADAVDITYYSQQEPHFTEFISKRNLTIPNSIAVYANELPGDDWSAVVTGTAEDSAQITKYTTVLEPFVDGTITTQVAADARAAAILSKVLSEQLSDVVTVPHDARVELYDKIQIQDNR